MRGFCAREWRGRRPSILLTTNLTKITNAFVGFVRFVVRTLAASPRPGQAGTERAKPRHAGRAAKAARAGDGSAAAELVVVYEPAGPAPGLRAGALRPG